MKFRILTGAVFHILTPPFFSFLQLQKYVKVSENPQYRKLINSRKWTKLRAWKMAQTKYLCENCLENGRTTPATEVHHVEPVESGINPTHMKQLCYDPENLQSLCRDCHVKAHIELKSFTKELTQERNQKRTDAFVEQFLKKP